MKHIGDLIQTGLLGMLDQDGEKDFPHQTMSFSMGGFAPAVSYISGNRGWSAAMPQPAQSALGVTAPMVANAVWNPDAGKSGPEVLPAVWDTSRLGAYPIRGVAVQEQENSAHFEQEPFYMIGRRPLDIKWAGLDLGKWFYNDCYFGDIGRGHDLRAEHQHINGSHGQNFGFAGSGEFQEQGREKDYAYDIPGIGTTKFKAKYMDMARLMVRDQIDADVDEMKELMDAFSIEDGEYMVNAYSFAGRNCQNYVDNVIATARELAKRNGDTLEIK